jgi:cytochrome c biogenesis protein CcmG, thiol:disulfide interchange protein DsbE
VNQTAEWLGRLRGMGSLGGMGRMRLAAIAVAAVAVIVALTLIGTGSGAHRPATPAAAKPFTLRVLGHPRKHLALQAFSGRPVIVNFFASWCAPCKRETPMMARFYRATHGNPVVIGIDSNDQDAKALAFVSKIGVSYPVVTDPYPARTAVAYGVPGLPATFFLNAQHRIVKRVFGALSATELSAGTALIAGRG